MDVLLEANSIVYHSAIPSYF